MTSFFAVILAIFALSGWFYQQRFGKVAVVLPFIFGIFISCVAYLLDCRNGEILKKCYMIGENLEDKIADVEGIFSHFGKAHNEGFLRTYTKILRLTYAAMAIFLLGLVILSMFYQVDNSQSNFINQTTSDKNSNSPSNGLISNK